MARTLHLLVCISAAMTATAGSEYTNQKQLFRPYSVEALEAMGYSPRDRINAQSAKLLNDEMVNIEKLSMAERRLHGGSYKIMNRGPKPIAISRRRAGGSDDKVLFPGPTSRNGAEKNRNIPEECQKYKLCENVPDYPVENAEKLIMELGEKIKYLLLDKFEDMDTPEITQRLGNDNNDLDFCDAHSKIIKPKGGFDKNNEYYDILNSDKKAIQGVRVEICKATNLPCRSFVCTQNNYESRCVQKYTYRPMLTINKVTQKEAEVQIAVPSCCACVGKSTRDLILA